MALVAIPAISASPSVSLPKFEGLDVVGSGKERKVHYIYYNLVLSTFSEIGQETTSQKKGPKLTTSLMLGLTCHWSTLGM